MKAEFKEQYEQLGLNIVYYRKRKKLTQLQLAELADIDRSHISAIELGNVGASLDVIFKLCEVLDITPLRLYSISEISPDFPPVDKHSEVNVSAYQWWILFCSHPPFDVHFHHR